jgi:HK97 family phage prohead protease
MKWKTFSIDITERRKNGGRITINTGAVDRDRDRVLPAGAEVQNYMSNPVVMWGHNYSDPYATVGKTTIMEMSDGNIDVDFELRPAANEHDPQNIVRLLWGGGWIRTASVGFNPLEAEPNDEGGFDFTRWELLEWSLVPIPANQEALRRAVKGFKNPDSDPQPEPVTEQKEAEQANEPTAEAEPIQPEPTDEERALQLLAEHSEIIQNILDEVKND